MERTSSIEIQKTIKVELTLLEDMLGTLPADEEVYRSYIASKAPDSTNIEEEVAAIGVDAVAEKGITVFARNPEGNPIIYDYLIKGFFKNAGKAMNQIPGSNTKGLSAYRTKIDNHVFVEPRMIPINYDGEIGICERPLRASTAQGERVALAASESIKAGSTIVLTIQLLNEKMDKCIYEWLDYGRFNGLGQWHNSGKGRFTWREITE